VAKAVNTTDAPKSAANTSIERINCRFFSGAAEPTIGLVQKLDDKYFYLLGMGHGVKRTDFFDTNQYGRWSGSEPN
jgi:hypothetical protein